MKRKFPSFPELPEKKIHLHDDCKAFEESRRKQQDLLALCRKLHGGNQRLSQREVMILDIDTYTGNRSPKEEWNDEMLDRKKYVPRKPILRIYGLTRVGQTVLIHVHDFQPYFFVHVRDGFDQKEIDEFEANLNHSIRSELGASNTKTKYVHRLQLFEDKISLWIQFGNQTNFSSSDYDPTEICRNGTKDLASWDELVSRSPRISDL